MRGFCWLLAALPACGSPDDSPGVEYGLRNQDWDGDGYARPDDCNDSDPEAFPGASERCNGIDDDCNAAIDDGISVTYHRDRDGDGYGAPDEAFDICWHPDGYVENADDCDDGDVAISPAGTEVCDILGADEDCNGVANEADPAALGLDAAYIDADQDGFGTGAADQIECFVTPGLATVDGDCDDTEAARNPLAVEVCDAEDLDEDCDGLSDDLDPEGPVGTVGWYADADGDGFGDSGPGPKWFCEGVPSDYVSVGGDCDDADASAYPNRYEECDDGIDNDCDGAPDDCGPIPAIDLAGADLVVGGPASASTFGDTVSWADVDGDGTADLIVGAKGESTAYTGAGGVHIIPGATRGVVNTGDVQITVIEGGVANQAFASYVIGIPDADGDGYDEIAAGTAGSTASDGIWIFDAPFGTATTPQTAAGLVLQLGDSTEQCGSKYATGDLNDDGILDHVVGCPNTGTAWGLALLVLGPVSGTVTAADGRVTGTDSDDNFGKSLAVVGDTDGDGTADLAVGASNFGAATTGAFFVVSGAEFAGADVDVESVSVGMFEGLDHELTASAMTSGDVNGDGYVDVLVGAPAATIGTGAGTGRVYGILGPFEGTMSADVQFEGEDAEDKFGDAVASGGDVNGDGLDDVLVGAPVADHGATAGTLGSAYLFVGPLTAGTYAATAARVRLDGESSADECGTDVGLVPDMTGDGRADVLIGASKRRDPSVAGGANQYGGVYLVGSEAL